MIAPPLLFVGFALLFLVGMLRDNPNDLPSTFKGEPAPALAADPLGDIPTFDRDTIAQGGLKLVNFWASWCAPCRVEHPNLIELSKELPVYGVNQKDLPEDALAFLEELTNPFEAITVDPTGRKSVEWGVYGLPETFVVNGKGEILTRIVGPLTDRVIEESLRPVLDAAGL